MRDWRMRVVVLVCAGLLALNPAPSQAILPIVALLAKQLVKDALTSTVKDMLLGSLRDMGCKGVALANALQALDARSPRTALGGGLPGMPALPGGAGMPNLPNLPNTPSMPNMPNMSGLGGAMGTMPPDMAAAMLRANPQMAGLLGGLAPGAGLPPGLALDPQQMAMFAQMQTAMTQPLSPSETLATIDELAEVGLLPPALQTELKECMVLLPQAAPALGMGMGMLAPVLPKLREARAQMLALSPSEQDEFAATMVQELQGVPAKDRKAFVDQLGGGFFPPRVVEGVKARLGAQ